MKVDRTRVADPGDVYVKPRKKSQPAPEKVGGPAVHATNILLANPAKATPPHLPLATEPLVPVVGGDIARQLTRADAPKQLPGSRGQRRAALQRYGQRAEAHRRAAEGDAIYKAAFICGLSIEQMKQQISVPRDRACGYMRRLGFLPVYTVTDAFEMSEEEKTIDSDAKILAMLEKTESDGTSIESVYASILDPEYLREAAVRCTVDGVNTGDDGTLSWPTKSGGLLSKELEMALDSLTGEELERVRMRSIIVLDHTNILRYMLMKHNAMTTTMPDEEFFNGKARKTFYGDVSKTLGKDVRSFDLENSGAIGLAKKSYVNIYDVPASEARWIATDIRELTDIYNNDLDNVPLAQSVIIEGSPEQNKDAYENNLRRARFFDTFSKMYNDRDGAWTATPAQMEGLAEAMDFLHSKQSDLEQAIDMVSRAYAARVQKIKEQVAADREAERLRLIEEKRRQTEAEAEQARLRDAEVEAMAAMLDESWKPNSLDELGDTLKMFESMPSWFNHR